ncbi:P-loop containing nucleoside triphosphate hydrolase [Fusarium oxysporum f. sp. vasinfectum]|nr:P-loop containing nucleoside triphosphate hydrolase [Fusarium oxysporum f. sp. vasinfectum]
MYISAVLTLFALGFCHAAAASASEVEAIEPLFLEFSIQEVLTNTSWIPVVEPWASQYVSAVRDGRYGDAVWARYHIAGDVHDGIVGGTTNMTVLQSIEEDALGYKLNDPEDYAKAQKFYAQTSDHDGHKDIIQTLSHIYNQDISHLEARVTYSTTCSTDFNAAKADCTELLDRMPTRRTNIEVIFWLNGMAGTGKSTISRTVARSRPKQGDHRASFFFKRGETDRGNLTKFVPTVARQLAWSTPGVATFIKNAVEADPAIANKAIREQFEKLVQEPLSKVAVASLSRQSVVLIVDALDECEKEPNVSILLELFSTLGFAGSLCIRVLITSRPELLVRLGFLSIGHTLDQQNRSGVR